MKVSVVHLAVDDGGVQDQQTANCCESAYDIRISAMHTAGCVLPDASLSRKLRSNWPMILPSRNCTFDRPRLQPKIWLCIDLSLAKANKENREMGGRKRQAESTQIDVCHTHLIHIRIFGQTLMI